MKKLFAFIIAAAMLLTLAACGGSKSESQSPAPQQSSSGSQASQSEPASQPESSQPEQGNPQPAANGASDRITKLWGTDLCSSKHAVHMKLRMNIEGEEVVMEYGLYDGKMYNDFTYQGMHSSMLYKDEIFYMIMHDEKMVMSMDPTKMQGVDMQEMENNANDPKVKWSSGTEAINGVTYEYDEMTEEGDDYTTRFYFAPGSDTLRWMKSGDEYIEVLEYDDKVDKSWFELPAGYTMMDMGSMGGQGQ